MCIRDRRKAGAVNARLFYLYSRRIKKRGINMKKFNWLLVMLLLALVPALQSCDDDGYSIGDIGWDWATAVSYTHLDVYKRQVPHR